MNNAAGTLESVVIELSKLLRPLEYDLATPSQAKAFLAQMGFVLTDAQVAGISEPLSTAANNATSLVEIVEVLLEAIETENYGTIATKSIEAIQKIADTINAFSTIGSQLSGVVEGSADEIAKRLFDYLLFNYLNSTKEVNYALELAGLLERDDYNEASEDPDQPPFTVFTYNFNQLSDWLSNPADQLRSLYDWGDNFDGRKLFSQIETILAREGLPVIYDDSGATPRLDAVFIEALPKTDVTPQGLFIRIKDSLSSVTQTLVISNDVRIALKIDTQLPPNTGLSILPNGEVSFVPTVPGSPINGDFSLQIIAEQTLPPDPFILFGQAGGSRLELRKFTLTMGTSVNWDGSQANGSFQLEGDAEDVKILIDSGSGDGFLAQIIPDTRIEADFSIQMGVSTDSGFYFSGSSSLEIQLPTHITLGPIDLESLTLSAILDADDIPVSVGTNLRARLGPLVTVVENMGVTAALSLPPNNNGNLGPLQFDFGFKPPNGVGLSLDTGVVKGGGYLYFDFDREEYAGALELVFSGFLTLKAIGLITTRLPDGSKGFSLLIIITAEFGMGLQLGFGFVLLGVGGLLGLNRTMKLEPLAEGVRTGATENVLFPQNVIENAPRIISDLRRFFPPEEGIFLIGPMAKLGWGTPALITLSLGIIFEIPGNIAILGVLKVVLPEERAALLILQVNFIGAIEFDKQRAFFFASMFESRILFITLEGEMGVLVAWGSDSNFVVSVGGFHPQFVPPPLPFPSPQRISLNILNESWGRIRIMGYFAVTSNTVQLGARAELFFGFSEFKLEGHLAFDALFQFDPFFFIIEISCGVSLKVFGIGLFSISLKFSLEGPTPWRAKGYGKLKLLFFSIKANFDFTWGEQKDTSLPPIEVLPILQAEYEKLSNWTAQLPASSNLLVSLNLPEEGSEELVLHPVGTLAITQRAVPLDLRLDKIGNQKPVDGDRFSLEVTEGLKKLDDLSEQFAIAQFQDFKDAEKLSQAAFQPEDSGLSLAVSDDAFATGKAVKRNIRYETHIIDKQFLFVVVAFFEVVNRIFTHFLNGNAVTKLVVSKHYQQQLQPFEEKIVLTPEQFVVASTVNNRVTSQEMVFTSEAKARECMQKEIAKDATRQDLLHVIPAYEVNTRA
ncbi:MAG: DUF6603 domain-containing protein [Cyanobacteria bacterium P01_F01_bin.3]